MKAGNISIPYTDIVFYLKVSHTISYLIDNSITVTLPVAHLNDIFTAPIMTFLWRPRRCTIYDPKMSVEEVAALWYNARCQSITICFSWWNNKPAYNFLIANLI